MTSPVFFDATGHRRKWVGRLAAAVLLLALIAAAVFAATVIAVPTATPLDIGREREQPLPFLTHVARLRHKLPRLTPPVRAGEPLSVGFYVPWDPDSAVSLRQHYNALDWIIAADAQVNTANQSLISDPDAKLRALTAGRLHRPRQLLMIQNLSNEKWDGQGMASLLADGRRADALVSATLAAVQKDGWQGAVFDIENMPDSALPAYLVFLERAHARFAKAGLPLALTVPAGEPAWDLARFSHATDYLILMAYDEHWSSSPPGPIASMAWFASVLRQRQRDIPAEKTIVAIGNYAYDWQKGGPTEERTFEEAVLTAKESESRIRLDPVSLNPTFAYADDQEKVHHVWMLDAVTASAGIAPEPSARNESAVAAMRDARSAFSGPRFEPDEAEAS